MNIEKIFIFITAVIGLTHIIVDPATIMQPVRNLIDKYGTEWLKKLFSCYQCCGTWVGFLCGYVLISKDPLVVFMCGMSGSFLSSWAATYLNYLEAQSIVNIGEEE